MEARPRMEPPRWARVTFACFVLSAVYVTVKRWLERCVFDYFDYLHQSESQLRISTGREIVSWLFLALYIYKYSRLSHKVIPLGICIVSMAIGVGELLDARLGEGVAIMVELSINLAFTYILLEVFDRILPM